MPKFKAENCKNFTSKQYKRPGEQVILHLCSTEYCADKDDCDGEIKEEIPSIRFEPKIPPIGQEETLPIGF